MRKTELNLISNWKVNNKYFVAEKNTSVDDVISSQKSNI